MKREKREQGEKEEKGKTGKGEQRKIGKREKEKRKNGRNNKGKRIKSEKVKNPGPCSVCSVSVSISDRGRNRRFSIGRPATKGGLVCTTCGKRRFCEAARAAVALAWHPLYNPESYARCKLEHQARLVQGPAGGPFSARFTPETARARLKSRLPTQGTM